MLVFVFLLAVIYSTLTTCRKTQSTKAADRSNTDKSSMNDRSDENLELVVGELLLMSGFLFHADCQGFALAGKRSNSIWNDSKSNVPMQCRMENLPIVRNDDIVPWCTNEMESIICSHDFLRQDHTKANRHSEDDKLIKRDSQTSIFEEFDASQAFEDLQDFYASKIMIWNGNSVFPTGRMFIHMWSGMSIDVGPS